MFRKEADWISEQLGRFPPAEISPLVNLGSSSGEFRTDVQPWIDQAIFRPLVERGVSVVHSDIKDQPGVDIVCDILTASGRAALARIEPKAMICSNLLEHVEDPQAMLDACLDVLAPGGLLVVTVPRSYPYHRDPIDTLFRPAPEEVAGMIGGRAEVMEGMVLKAGSYRDQVRERPLILFRPVFRFFVPFLGYERWKRSLGKLYWLVAPYKSTCLVARKRAGGAPA